ncbi:MAG: YfiT family bacillithiol transferase [Flavobacteriaceae bacterium]
MSLEALRFPIGKFNAPEGFDRVLIEQSIQELANFPTALVSLQQRFSSKLWQIPYREGGWTAAQVVHHLADSHMHSYIRFKLAALEDCPTIKAYEEKHWAEQLDASDSNIESSISILKGVHKRLVLFLQSLDEQALKRRYFHPEMNATVAIYEAIPMYAWHGKHHLGHLQLVLQLNA